MGKSLHCGSRGKEWVRRGKQLSELEVGRFQEFQQALGPVAPGGPITGPGADDLGQEDSVLVEVGGWSTWT